MLAICWYGAILSFCSIFCIYTGNFSFYAPYLPTLAALLILIGTLFYHKNKKAIWGTVVGFILMPISSLYSLYFSYDYSRLIGNNEEEYKTTENIADADTCAIISNGEEDDTAYNSESALNGEYTFEFVVSETTYRISFNKEEETAQLYVEGEYTPEGKTFYGYANLTDYSAKAKSTSKDLMAHLPTTYTKEKPSTNHGATAIGLTTRTTAST